MSIEPIKFTVIIPTRERLDTLKWSLRTVLAQTYKNLEIIVSDNVSNDGTEELVKSINDPRIRYINTGKRLSMTGNWEFAMSHVSDGWVSLIGDDDGLMPGALEKVAKLIKETECQAIQSRCCLYLWPSFQSKAVTQKNWDLGVVTATGWEWRDSQEYLEKYIYGKGLWELPYTYSGGFIQFSILQEIRDRTGKFYHSHSPEVYAAFAIASLTKKHVYSHEPFAISGVSGNSNGAAWGGNLTDNTELDKFEKEYDVPSHEAIPLNADGRATKCWRAIMFDSYLKTRPLRASSQNEDYQHQLMLYCIEDLTFSHKGLKPWCESFALKHGLDYKLAEKKAKIYRYVFTIPILLEKLRPMLKFNMPFYLLLRAKDPLVNNVYEASIRFSAIRSVKVSIFSHILNRWKNR